MSAPYSIYEGSCHCGAIGFEFETRIALAAWSVRACQCSFCRQHGARTTSDPHGHVRFRITDPTKLHRYRFGSCSADFLICRYCGVYVAADLTTERGQFATLNVNALRPPLASAAAVPVSYKNESAEEKRSWRERNWTPVVVLV